MTTTEERKHIGAELRRERDAKRARHVARQRLAVAIREDRGEPQPPWRAYEIQADAIATFRERCAPTGDDLRTALEAERQLRDLVLAELEDRDTSATVAGLSRSVVRAVTAPTGAPALAVPSIKGDGLTMFGYASRFNTPTRIANPHEGTFTEVIVRGAFAASLRRGWPLLQFNHGRHAQIGDLPLGVIKQLTEDSRGLYVVARLFANYLVEPVREMIAAGVVTGQSIRFAVDHESWRAPTTPGGLALRTIFAAELYELGPVVRPAQSTTSVQLRADRKRTHR